MRKLFVLAIFICCQTVFSQATDLARLEFTYFPQKNSDNSFRRARAQIAFPFELKKDGTYLIPGFEYRNVNFIYDDPEVFNTRDLDRFQSFTTTLGYTFKINEEWRFGAETGVKIASNFSTGKIINEDLIYTGTVLFVKIKEDERYYEPWRLIVGLRYSTTAGFPFPLPIINYYKRWTEKWSYSIGPPKSNLKYYFNDKHNLQAFVTLDGFFANVQKNFDVTPGLSDNNNIADSMSMTILLSGLGYEYGITEHLSFYFYAGHTLINDIRLRDGNRDDVYTINKTNTFYGRGGLKFSIF
ncbi:DUF6268 family outer membrane beta-barrel protein [Gramella sp. GC03-9]|uniref:DUF6268 family outer membrane beta-barrel protein n=1 Tax=Christiangramia oceanisediminis TaxID=2920386 RepID=A0A9X2KVE7_9FLAO|nr:DUF6268 family outer membrane beta-barrel protein [Gramella oceanisediminis]MCP9198358.1 DUF6268 family outer membrane beta-barrel protein [Gramella oceanisediminis]